jgi:hypothetical protein
LTESWTRSRLRVSKMNPIRVRMKAKALKMPEAIRVSLQPMSKR